MFYRIMIVVCFCVYATDMEIQLLEKNSAYQQNPTSNEDFTEMTEKENFNKWLITPDPDLQTPTFSFFSNKKDLWDLSTKDEWLYLSTFVSMFFTKPVADVFPQALFDTRMGFWMFSWIAAVCSFGIAFFYYFQQSQFIVGHNYNDQGEVVSNVLLPLPVYEFIRWTCIFFGLGFTMASSAIILAYIFFPLDDVISYFNVEHFFDQHPQLRNMLIPMSYIMQCVTALCTIPLIYIPKYFVWNLLVTCAIMLYFLLLFFIKCCYLPKFISNVLSLNHIKTAIWKKSLKTLSTFKYIYYLLENEFDEDTAGKILDFIQPIPKHLWHSKQLFLAQHGGSTWHCFLKGLFHMKTKKEKLHFVNVLHTHWHGEPEDLIGSWVNTEGQLCEVGYDLNLISHKVYYVNITNKQGIRRTEFITDRGEFLELAGPLNKCWGKVKTDSLKVSKHSEKVEWINTKGKQSKPWYRTEPIRF